MIAMEIHLPRRGHNKNQSVVRWPPLSVQPTLNPVLPEIGMLPSEMPTRVNRWVVYWLAAFPGPKPRGVILLISYFFKASRQPYMGHGTGTLLPSSALLSAAVCKQYKTMHARMEVKDGKFCKWYWLGRRWRKIIGSPICKWLIIVCLYQIWTHFHVETLISMPLKPWLWPIKFSHHNVWFSRITIQVS